MMMLCWWRPCTGIRFMNIGTSSRPQMSAHCSVWKTHTAANWKNFVNNKNSWKVKVSSVSMQFKHPPDHTTISNVVAGPVCSGYALTREVQCWWQWHPSPHTAPGVTACTLSPCQHLHSAFSIPPLFSPRFPPISWLKHRKTSILKESCHVLKCGYLVKSNKNSLMECEFNCQVNVQCKWSP